jgi:peptidoglycan hydrolase CwlO-like protein
MARLNARVHCRRNISALFLSALVASTSLTVVLVPRPAGADQISDLKAKATAVAQQLVEEQLQVGAYQQQYSVESEKVAADARAIAQIGQQIGLDQQLISAKSDAVRQQAIRSYMSYGTGSTTPNAVLFGGGQETGEAASEYSSIAVGNITTAIDQLRTAQSTLRANQAALDQQQSQDRSDQNTRATVLGQADNSASQLQSLNAHVTGQLAAAVTAQATAQANAAAAAVAAAQRATTKAGPTRTSTSPTTPASPSAGSGTSGSTTPATGGGPSTTTDPALNPFLQCVVQAESGGDYSINTGNGYYGAFQFSQSTWDFAAQEAGRPDLVGILPSSASKADQDSVAVALYALDGEQPWLGDRCSQ